MISSIYSRLYTKNPNLFYLKWVLIFALLIVVVLLYKTLKPPEMKKEGFTQKEPFVVKLNNDAIDPFYVELYDTPINIDYLLLLCDEINYFVGYFGFSFSPFIIIIFY